MRHHDKHTPPPLSGMAPRGRARSGSRHGFCANSRRCVQPHAGLDSKARRRRCGTAHRISTTYRRQPSLPPAPRCCSPSPATGRRLGRILESRRRNLTRGELMNRGSLRPCPTPTPWSAACMPRCQLIGRKPGIALCGDSILARESAGSPLLLATADARPRGLGCMFRRLRGHMVRCARGRAGRRNARQTRPGFFFPPAANRKRRETNNCSIGKPSSCRRPSRWHGEWLPPTAVRFFVTDHASF